MKQPPNGTWKNQVCSQLRHGLSGREYAPYNSTYRGTTTNEPVRHVAGHGTSPSIQAGHLGTHIDEGFTVTTSKQKTKRHLERQE